MNEGPWDSSRLAELVEDTIGGLWGIAPDSSKKSSETDVLVVRGADFRDWDTKRAQHAALRRIPSQSLDRRRLAAGDLVLEVSGGGPSQPVGRAIVIDERTVRGSPRPLICSNFCRKLRLKPHVDPYFVKRQLDLLYQSGHTDKFQTSTTNIRNLKVVDFLEQTELAVPPLTEQKALTALIDKLESTRSSAFGHVNGAKRSLERFRVAIFAAACSGRLTADWRLSHPMRPVQQGPILSTQALKHVGSANTDELIDIPETWGWWAIESAMDEVIDYRGRTPPSQSEGPIPHVRTSQIRGGVIQWLAVDRFVTHDTYQEYMVRGIPRRGDVLFTMEGPLGEVAVVDKDEPFSLAQRILLFRSGNRLIPEFLAMALVTPFVRQAIEYRATGSGIKGIAYKRLRSVMLPIPPKQEQIEISRRVEDILSLANQIANKVDNASVRIQQTSQALLSKAFRGELIPEKSKRT